MQAMQAMEDRTDITLLRSQYIMVQHQITTNCLEAVALVDKLKSIHHQILEEHMRSKREQGLQQMQTQKRLEATILQLQS